jgi:hypothetical protein
MRFLAMLDSPIMIKDAFMDADRSERSFLTKNETLPAFLSQRIRSLVNKF